MFFHVSIRLSEAAGHSMALFHTLTCKSDFLLAGPLDDGLISAHGFGGTQRLVHGSRRCSRVWVPRLRLSGLCLSPSRSPSLRPSVGLSRKLAITAISKEAIGGELIPTMQPLPASSSVFLRFSCFRNVPFGFGALPPVQHLA